MNFLLRPARAPSEVALAFLFFHRSGIVMVDQPTLPLGCLRTAHLADNGVEGGSLRADRAGERVASERPNPHFYSLRNFTGRKRQPIVVDQDQRTVPLNHPTFLREIERHNRDVLGPDIFPDIEFGPVGQREDAHGFARFDARIEQAPQFGTLVAWIPAVRGGAMRENALLG